MDVTTEIEKQFRGRLEHGFCFSSCNEHFPQLFTRGVFLYITIYNNQLNIHLKLTPFSVHH
ncbi:hypothetical protein, partial [Candidatus Cardinium sp. cByotN1]|uniref:hypothetical protein n=1 Tax=Candidatus Cardinium sp. cByotN1 TaxID=2699439 RepID=UPI001FB486A2